MKLHLPVVLPAILLLCPLLVPAAPEPAQSRALVVRDELTAVYADWAKARTSLDEAAFERMLSPDFWVQIGPQRLTRAQFIAEISRAIPGARLVRFDPRILTLGEEHGDWYAVITEKLEVEFELPDGKKQRSYSLWVTKDGFRKDGERWTILSSEAIGWERWEGGQEPPFDDWSS